VGLGQGSSVGISKTDGLTTLERVMPVREKPIQEMRKEEYQRYTENLKDCLETGEELQGF